MPQTGKPAAGFGRDGFIEIRCRGTACRSIYKHVAILGTYPGEVPLGPTGDTRAFDVRTGKKLWQFQNVPLPGQAGHETWLDYGWRDRSGTNVWAFYMTLDSRARHPLHAGLGPGRQLLGRRPPRREPLWQFDRRRRRRDREVPLALPDRASRSVGLRHAVAAGARRHHAEAAGAIPALASIGKTGYMFILDRVTGKPIFGVEERPVPKGEVPDEWYSPTQPFPVKPARPFARVEFNKERDMVRPEDTSPQHVAECQALWDKSGGFHNAGPFTPWLFHEDNAPPRSSVQFPGAGGGVNWGGPAADPAIGDGVRQRS